MNVCPIGKRQQALQRMRRLTKSRSEGDAVRACSPPQGSPQGRVPDFVKRMLYVRPSSWSLKLKVCVHPGGVCPGSVGTRQALLQGWLLCVGFVCLANVPDLVRRLFGR